MTRVRLTLGRAGENAAVDYLSRNGLRIVDRNFRCRMGELDIIARDGATLVFVEVRTVAGSAFGAARERVTKRKIHKLRQLAMYYIQSKKLAALPLRFDVIAVTMKPDGSLLSLDHIINAF